MEPHPAREWIQMTPMNIFNVESLFYCLLATVHNVSSRSRMTAHMEPAPSQGTDPDDTNGHRYCGISFYCSAALLYMSHPDHG
eukprot:scaffold12214_cov33-Attheya_sp.AAC.4